MFAIATYPCNKAISRSEFKVQTRARPRAIAAVAAGKSKSPLKPIELPSRGDLIVEVSPYS